MDVSHVFPVNLFFEVQLSFYIDDTNSSHCLPSQVKNGSILHLDFITVFIMKVFLSDDDCCQVIPAPVVSGTSFTLMSDGVRTPVEESLTPTMGP